MVLVGGHLEETVVGRWPEVLEALLGPAQRVGEAARSLEVLGDADEVVGRGLVLREHGDDDIDIAGSFGEGLHHVGDAEPVAVIGALVSRPEGGGRSKAASASWR